MYMIDLQFSINCAFVGVCGRLHSRCTEQIILNICLEGFVATDLNKTSARLTEGVKCCKYAIIRVISEPL